LMILSITCLLVSGLIVIYFCVVSTFV